MLENNDKIIRIDITGGSHSGKSNLTALFALFLRETFPDLPIEIVNLDGDLQHAHDRIEKMIDESDDGTIPGKLVQAAGVVLVDRNDPLQPIVIKYPEHHYLIATESGNVSEYDRPTKSP